MKSQIELLSAYIRQSLPPRALNGYSCFADEIRLEPAFKDMGNGQLRTALIFSKAVLDWDDFPYTECPPSLVFSAVCLWFSDYAGDAAERYELDQPAVELEVIDTKTAILTIEVSLVEEIFIIPDEKGSLLVDGCRYRVADPVIHCVDGAAVVGLGDGGPV